MWKTYLNFVLGGLSVVLIIGGLLWFFLVEMSPESAGAVVGGLMSLFGWFQTREDKKEQKKDKDEIIGEIRNYGTLNPTIKLLNEVTTQAIRIRDKFVATNTVDDVKTLQGLRIELANLTQQTEAMLGDDLASFYDVYHKTVMKLAYAINGLEKTNPIPEHRFAEWNDVVYGESRKLLDAEVREVTAQLRQHLGSFESLETEIEDTKLADAESRLRVNNRDDNEDVNTNDQDADNHNFRQNNDRR